MTLIADSVDTLKLVIPDVLTVPHALNTVGRKNHPEIVDLLPFKSGWHMQVYGDDHVCLARMVDCPGAEGNQVRQLSPSDIAEFQQRLEFFPIKNTTEAIYEAGAAWHETFGPQWYAQDRFTYVRRKNFPPGVSSTWDDIATQLAVYLDTFLLPQLLATHKERVARALPQFASFDLGVILPALWVLECEETCSQGTAFALEGVGLVTCDHVIGTATKAFKATDFAKKYPVSVVSRHAVIDLAVLRIDVPRTPALLRGSAADMKQLDPLAVVGFPNYRFGDSGTIVTGNVAGFRVVSGIRRLLTSAPIITGTSGGPVLDGQGRVVGVAVTGAPRMDQVRETENHGVIPIDALDLITPQASSPSLAQP